ncbi:MAG: hypothetical protein K0S06_4121 [Microvirga sp.]|nr:hypothetical protein [Microvirga sp.]
MLDGILVECAGMALASRSSGVHRIRSIGTTKINHRGRVVFSGLKLCLASGLAMLVAGCVSVAPHALSAQDIQSWKVVAVEGIVPDTTFLAWPKIENQYLERALPVAPAKLVVDPNSGREQLESGERPPITEEVRRGARGFAKTQFEERLHHAMSPVRAMLNGQRPVKLVTTLSRLDVPSAARQVIQGAAMAVLFGPTGALPNTTLTVSTDVVDAKTGAVLASYPQRTLVRPGGEALISFDSSDPYSTDVVVGLLRGYQRDFASWLLKTGG